MEAASLITSCSLQLPIHVLQQQCLSAGPKSVAHMFLSTPSADMLVTSCAEGLGKNKLSWF